MKAANEHNRGGTKEEGVRLATIGRVQNILISTATKNAE